MPTVTINQLALRSTNPVKRAIDVFCVVVLQLLTLMALTRQPDPERRRQHALSTNSILARLDAGETFDLPLFVITPIRTFADQFREQLTRAGLTIEPFSTPHIAMAQIAPAPANARRQRRPAPRPAKPALGREPLRASASPIQATALLAVHRRPFERKAQVLQSLSTSYSFRIRNE